ncbi:MAG: alpha-N-arabinofuranosidase [Abitibacteriaceae bacterium]|nr:alpha-N-arabinofuranosidase [Abditibacteriaceae bacterium]MBV9864424.1 alpha-N-arabinofuranosidase [Abditibacteriaceae bacterium]
MQSVQRVVVVPEETIGEINPYLHGHFAEHLGELIYPGICVPPDCNIPNTNGIRNDVVAALNPLNIPVLRWPGGCYADDYHWRDGIGPLENRPMRVNRHWGAAEEPNHFGTHEFMNFCRFVGAEPYFAGNVGSGTPAELRNWVEYCNFAGNSSLADERRTNGAEEPFKIRYWGIGNENWGCGGNMNPEQYADEFCRYRSFVSNYSGTQVEAIACGQDNADWDWTRRFMEHMRRNYHNRLRSVQGLAMHYYCGTAGTAIEYTNEQWLELLAKSYAIEGIVTGCRSIMDEYDAERRIKLILDEWGAWHPVEKGKPTGGLYQQNTMRDACVAALSLDVFHNQADKLFMANIAQLINVLQAVLLVEEDKCIKTPTYHVFDLYQPHKGAQAVRFETYADTVTDGGPSAHYCQTRYLERKTFALRAVHGSASVRDGALCVTAVNTHPTEAIELEVELHRSGWNEVQVVTLNADDIHAHNTFSQPENVQLAAPQTVTARDGFLRVPMPAGSVIRLQGKLA